MTMFEKLGGRKTILGVFLVAVGVGVDLLSAKGLTDTMSNYLLVLGLGYFGSNVMTKAAHAIENASKAKKPPVERKAPAVDLGPVLEAVQGIQEAVESAQAAPTDISRDIKAIQNQNVAITEALKQISALNAQTYQTLVAAINPGPQNQPRA